MTDTSNCGHVEQPLVTAMKAKLAAFPELEAAARSFDMLGDAVRLRILYILSQSGRCCVNHLAEILDMGVSAVSHHLRKLRDRQLVLTKREGLNIYYFVNSGEEARNACQLAQQLLLGKK